MDYNITYRQKDKGWQFIISYKATNGKWKQRGKQGFKTKKEAKAAAEKRLLELKLELERKSENENIVLNEKYSDITFKTVANKSIEHLALYKEAATVKLAHVSVRSFKKLHEKPIPDIKKADIQEQIDEHVKNNNLKENTLKNYVLNLNRVFKYYKDNYDESYELPTKKLIYPKKVKKEKKALTKNELDSLLSYFKDNRPEHEYLICLIAGTCGLRYSEIMGLTWNDVDDINSLLHVNKQWKQNKDGVWAFGSLKTINSKRAIPIPPKTLSELKTYHKSSITDINNKIFARNSESTRVTLHITLANIADISIHELRHTYATLLIANGIDFKTAAEYLGDDVQQIILTYSHVTNEMRKSAAEKISKIF
jgi:integrase